MGPGARGAGYKPRTTREKLRVAEALETLPCLVQALEAGGLSWCAARELTRVAVPETEPAWLEAARGKTLRELEVLVASRAPGDSPDATALELPRSRVLRFEVAADTFATFRSDHAHVGAQTRQVSDATATASVPTGTTPPTRTAQAHAHPSPRTKQSIPPALRRTVLTRDRHHCRVPGCTNATFVDVHHVELRSEGGRHEASNLLTLCSAHHPAPHRGELLIHREHEESFTFRHADGAAYGNPSAP